MGNMNIVEILKIGLPGLVFLLSALSFKLLSKEQGKEHPNAGMLNSIKMFMSINVVLAVLTMASPIIDNMLAKKSEFARLETQEASQVMKAKTGTTDLESGAALVCQGSEYLGRYLLVRDIKTNRLKQVFAKSVTPCQETQLLILSEDDVSQLGWSPEAQSSDVDIAVSPRGFMFAITI